MNPRHHEVEDIKKNPKHCKYQQISLLLNGCKYKYTTFTFDKSLKGALKNLSGWNARPKKVITPPHPPTPPPPHPNTHTQRTHGPNLRVIATGQTTPVDPTCCSTCYNPGHLHFPGHHPTIQRCCPHRKKPPELAVPWPASAVVTSRATPELRSEKPLRKCLVSPMNTRCKYPVNLCKSSNCHSCENVVNNHIVT